MVIWVARKDPDRGLHIWITIDAKQMRRPRRRRTKQYISSGVFVCVRIRGKHFVLTSFGTWRECVHESQFLVLFGGPTANAGEKEKQISR